MGGKQVEWLYKIFVVNLALQIKVLGGILVIIKFQGSFSHFLGSKSISVILLGFKTISVIFKVLRVFLIFFLGSKGIPMKLEGFGGILVIFLVSRVFW